MLRIIVPATEYWDEQKEEFIQKREQTLQLEHSLVSISKWESKWNKPFLSKDEKTHEETIDYIRCMTLNQNIDPEVYTRLTSENIEQINAYIEAPMTATTFREDKSKKKNDRKITTSELIYWWMISYNIPPEYQKWHLSRLLTLIRICEDKAQPPKKRSPKEIMAENAAINEARKKEWNTKG